MFGEGDWKADEDYGEPLREVSEGHDAEALAGAAAEDLEPDLEDSEDEDVADSALPGSEEDPEW
jgi:hypothetical protein